MASRRQDAWEAQLKEKAFLTATIKPIVDDTITFKTSGAVCAPRGQA
jgi:hypothetical protein